MAKRRSEVDVVGRMRIYIAGPYTGESEEAVWQNVVRAIDAGIEVYKRGHYPYIPHLTHFVEDRSRERGAGLRWEDYLNWDRVWLKACDALLHLGSSKGADLELNWAKRLGLQIFYKIEEIPNIGQPDVDEDALRDIGMREEGSATPAIVEMKSSSRYSLE